MITVIKRKKLPEQMTLTPAFLSKQGLPSKKKDDLMALLNKNYIPKFYSTFYCNLEWVLISSLKTPFEISSSRLKQQ